MNPINTHPVKGQVKGLRTLCAHGIALAALGLVALNCNAATTSLIAAKKLLTPPAAQPLSVVVGANVANPIQLKSTNPNNLPLNFSILSPPTHGHVNVRVGPMPTVIYTPNPNYLGPDSFLYSVFDGLPGEELIPVAKVTITVKKGLLINNVSVSEGNSGTKSALFTIKMTLPGSELDLVTVNYRTLDGTARGSGLPIITGADYLSQTGLLVFGENTSQFVSVPILGDLNVEQNESFLVELFNVSDNAVIVNGVGRGTITTDDFFTFDSVDTAQRSVGTAGLTPENSVVKVGEPVTLSLDWTHPVGWRKLDSVDLLISDRQGTVFYARWHEAANAFTILSPNAKDYLRTAVAGSPALLETPVAALDLKESTGGGPVGKTVTIDFDLIFKPQAAGRTFSVEAFAIDDAGNQQGFESVGTITVLSR